jgi:hypothetical protein
MKYRDNEMGSKLEERTEAIRKVITFKNQPSYKTDFICMK